MENKLVEIWIRGTKLCETTQGNEALEYFERIIAQVGYSIMEREEDGKIIKMV